MDKLENIVEKEDLDLEVIVVESENDRIDMEMAMEALFELGVEKILVEGGSRMIWEFVSKRMFDRFTIYIGPMLLGGSGPTIMGGPGFEDGPAGIQLQKLQGTPDGGILVEFIPDDQ
jgi:2,5-diamino-6-(ribosylamino)-4(3H)-pyrimidinone 5'-phosphate reductase